MTEPSTTLRSPLYRTDWLLLLALFALVLPLRLWLLHNTEVTARDSIGYIRYALQFEHKPWDAVLKDNHQHPGYPVLVWLTSLPVRAHDEATTPENMELSAQLVNLFASLLLIVPMYWLGRQFFDGAVCFGAVLLYQYLPISAQHLSDGISEPMFLVLLVTSLWQGALAVKERAIVPCALCGLCAGLAYLTRPEGALILPALLGTLIALQVRADTRCTWRRLLACAGTAVLTAVLVGSIYVIATGRVTNKLSAIETIKNLLGLVTNLWNGSAGAEQSGLGSLHLFAASYVPTDSKTMRLTHSAWALVSEINQGFHYIAGVPALLGLCWSVGTLRKQPGFWFITLFAAIHSLILIALAMSVFYVSDRHVMILVLLGCFFAVVGLRELPRRVLGLLRASDPAPWYRSASVWTAVLFVALFAFCLPKTTQRLHGNRVGNHLAGLWLESKIKTGDHIEDDHAWSHFFSGMLFDEHENPALDGDKAPTCYVVTTRSRDPELTRARQAGVLSSNAKVVYSWPESVEVEKARVIIYSQPRDPVLQSWRKKS